MSGSSLRAASVMALRKKFSRERLEEAGQRSARDARAKLEREIGPWVKDVDLVCRYFSVLWGEHPKSRYIYLSFASFVYQVRWY